MAKWREGLESVRWRILIAFCGEPILSLGPVRVYSACGKFDSRREHQSRLIAASYAALGKNPAAIDLVARNISVIVICNERRGRVCLTKKGVTLSAGDFNRFYANVGQMASVLIGIAAFIEYRSHHNGQRDEAVRYARSVQARFFNESGSDLETGQNAGSEGHRGEVAGKSDLETRK